LKKGVSGKATFMHPCAGLSSANLTRAQLLSLSSDDDDGDIPSVAGTRQPTSQAHEFFGNLLSSGGPLQTAVQASFSCYLEQLSPAQRLAFQSPAAADPLDVLEEVFGSCTQDSDSLPRSTALAALNDPDPTNRLKTIPNVLSIAECTALRDYCDQALAAVEPVEGSRDNVDGLPDFQVNLSIGELRLLLHCDGESAARQVCDLDRLAFGVACAGAPGIFLRKYTNTCRPWMSFHFDSNAVTANIALSSSEEHEGGELLCLLGGTVQSFDRVAGSATVHRDDVCHAVRPVESGNRYALLVFYHESDTPSDDVFGRSVIELAAHVPEVATHHPGIQEYNG